MKNTGTELTQLFAGPTHLEISPVELAGKLQSKRPPRLLDVREPQEHAQGALPNAKLIPLNKLAEQISEIEEWRGQEVVVYCHHGLRSLHAIAKLQSLGFSNLHNLSGGIDRWARELNTPIARY
jgi:adenylyltransferase/sulfurtransferase